MRGFGRAIVAAVLIAIVVAVVAWATAPDDRTGPPPTLVPLMGDRPVGVVAPAEDTPDYSICGPDACVMP